MPAARISYPVATSTNHNAIIPVTLGTTGLHVRSWEDCKYQAKYLKALIRCKCDLVDTSQTVRYLLHARHLLTNKYVWRIHDRACERCELTGLFQQLFHTRSSTYLGKC